MSRAIVISDSFKGSLSSREICAIARSCFAEALPDWKLDAIPVAGEGALDAQTLQGKVVCGVARRGAATGTPIAALAGAVEPGAAEALRDQGLTAAFSIWPGPMTLEDSCRHAGELYRAALDSVLVPRRRPRATVSRPGYSSSRIFRSSFWTACSALVPMTRCATCLTA